MQKNLHKKSLNYDGEKEMEKLITDMIMYVAGSLIHNSPYLLLGILVAVVMKVYIDPEKLKGLLLRKSNYSILGSVAFGAFTPLCACGTMAVIIAMLTTALPLGPIMAFLTSSPLMSPDGFILIAGIIDVKFAIALALASIIIGLGSGYITHFIETKTGFLLNQTRLTKKEKSQERDSQTCGCNTIEPEPVQINTCGCTGNEVPTTNNIIRVQILELCCNSENELIVSKPKFSVNEELETVEFMTDKISGFIKKIKWQEIGNTFIEIGVKQILLYYSVFTSVGFLINHFVPSSIIMTLFSADNIFSVPLAALIGLPLYVNGESAIPLINSLLSGGAGCGAMLAFLITGPGTSAGVIAGIATILKKRAIILYVLFLLFGGIFLGYLYDLLLAIGI